MELLLLFAILIIGFVMLIKGADFLIDGAVALSRKFKVPEIVIGLTVVAFGTSMPELVVNTFASFKGQGSIVYGNVIGSNIANILLILGITSLIKPITMQKNTVWKEIPYSLIAVIVLFFLSRNGTLFRGDAAVLLCFFVGFIIYIFFIAKTGELDAEETEGMGTGKMSIYLTLGFVGLMFGGKLVVDSAVKIAQMLHVSEKLISLTIVSIGTSLPELAASITAAKKGNSDMAIGNVVGSNIFNIFLIMGMSGLVRPIAYDLKFDFDFGVLLYATMILILSAFVFKKHVIQRRKGAIMLLSYLLYLIYSINMS
ncbi:MAG: calcium/sodium antiporter [Fusobacteriaceae bacterium]